MKQKAKKVKVTLAINIDGVTYRKKELKVLSRSDKKEILDIFNQIAKAI